MLNLFLIAVFSLKADRKLDVIPIRKIEANPINVAVSLTERTDSATIASICEYYGYINQPSQKDYTVFQHPKGSIIRYSFKKADVTTGSKYPTIEVKCKGTQKEKEVILKNLNFQKSGNSYERRGMSSSIRCISGTRGFLIIQQHLITKN